MNKKGIFISFEGNEGCGKTTITNKLKEKLENNGYEVTISREPGGVRISEEIRKIILNNEYIEMDDKTEALLYAAARRQHLVEKIIPEIEKGKIVICDRFIDSSLAYQGVGRNLGIEEVYEINKFAIGEFMPDKTFLLEIDYKLGLERANKRGELDRLEMEGDKFHETVANGYKKISKLYSDRIDVIDANRTIDDVTNDIYERVIKLLK